MINKMAAPYLALAEKRFPGIKASPNPLKPENLISDFTVEVPRAALTQIQNFIRSVYRASKTDVYKTKISPKDAEILSFKPKNDSVLMAYDFHLNAQGEPKLIEVNTNASGYLISSLVYELTQTTSEFGDPIKNIEKSFKSEAASGGLDSEVSAAIIDETLPQQKMLPEFYMYRDLFNSWGWKAVIDDYQNFRIEGNDLIHSGGSKINFLYNRLNDFYLARAESAPLRQAYLESKAVSSPQPHDYQTLADKQRLVEWSRPEFWQGLLSAEELRNVDQVLLKSFVPADFEDLEKLWSQRKKYFFKPLRMYGGKSAYKGANVSRGAFEKIFADDKSMIQEFCPAPKFKDAQGVEWKYDLRFFVYRDEIHLAIARAYQGQVTNFSTLGGGFCRIKFI